MTKGRYLKRSNKYKALPENNFIYKNDLNSSPLELKSNPSNNSNNNCPFKPFGNLNFPFNFNGNTDCPLDIIKNNFLDGNNKNFFSDDSSVSDIGEINPEKLNEPSPIINTRKIYFRIQKIKKRGKRRLKSNSKLHDNTSQYNIITKLKVYFTKSLLKQADYLYKKNIQKDQIKKDSWLKPIIPKEEKQTKNGEKKMNTDWFFKKTKEYLSSNLSGKFHALSKDYNKKQIDNVYTKNENKDLIAFLDQKVCNIYKEYINYNKSENEIFKDMIKMEDDIEKIRTKYKYDDDYINEVKKISSDLENILLGKNIKKVKT